MPSPSPTGALTTAPAHTEASPPVLPARSNGSVATTRPVRRTTKPAADPAEPSTAHRPARRRPSRPAPRPAPEPRTGHLADPDVTHEGGAPAVVLAPPRPAPRRPGLIPTDIADAISAVVGKATKAIRENEAGSRRGGEIENVHQMRVATRRIRAYLKAAKPALDPDAANGLRVDLSDLAQALGVVRDLDVMIEQLHSEAAALGEPDTAALEGLIVSLDANRSAARNALVTQLDAPTYDALLDELDETTKKPPVANPWADLTELGAAEFGKLAKAHRKMVKQFGEDPPDDDLHALRILGKRARYTAELQAKSKETGDFLEALADLQEVLGNHQDASVLEEQLRMMVAASQDPAAAIAAGRVIEGGRQRKIAARKAFPAAWKAVQKAARAAYPPETE